MRLVTSQNELQMVAAMQAARTAPGNQIAGQLSGSGTAALDFSKLITAASPMAGGGGGSADMGSATPSRPRMRASSPTGTPEEDDDFDWGGAGQGALQYGATGAAIGTKILPGWGTAIGAGVGAIGGALVGGFSDG